MVMPETGLRAVIAIALAATEVKKKENDQRQRQADQHHQQRLAERREEDARGERREQDTHEQRHDADVAVGPLLARAAARAEGAGGDREGRRDDPQRLQDPEDAGGGDGPTPMKRT